MIRYAVRSPLRRALLALVAGLAALVLPAGVAVAAGPPEATSTAYPSADLMPSMDSVFVLDKDGGVRVTETIQYTFDSSAGARHGIYRSITVRQGVADRPEVYRYYAMSDVSVSSPTGANTDVALADNGSTVTIKIGSAKETVRGTQTYIVTYHLANVVNPFTDSQTAEFYYNVFSGDAIAKTRATVSVTGPAGVSATDVRCARGVNGECDTATAGATSTFAVSALQSNENLTVATRYPLSAFGIIAPDIRAGGSPLQEGPAKLAALASVAGGVLAPILALVGMGTLLLTRGRDEWYAGLTPGLTPGRTPGLPGDAADPAASAAGRGGRVPVRRGGRPTVAVQFNPPPGVQPGLVGTVIDESADTLDVSASVIDLAVRGFLRIEEVEAGGMFSRTDWQLTRLVPRSGEVLRPYEQTLLEGIFGDSNPVLLSDLKNHFASTLSKVKDQLYGEVLDRGWFRSSPQTTRGIWMTLGSVLFGAGVMTAFFWGAPSRGVDRTAGLGLPIASGFILGVGLAIAGIIVAVAGSKLVAKTAEGSAVYAQSLGFKQYLVTAEAGQIRWEEAQDIFSRFLPYAIIFGVADKWASTFKQVAEAAAAAGQVILMPDWYIYHGSTFPDFDSITDGVDSFSTSASGTFQSTPGSSGGSGFSGGGSFGGGGVGGSSSGSW